MTTSTVCVAEASVFQLVAFELIYVGREHALSTRILLFNWTYIMVNRKVTMFNSKALVCTYS
jgi:predicted GNAT superfamily acetyltransferase